METRQMLVALVAALAVYLAASYAMRVLMPPPPPPATQPADTSDAPDPFSPVSPADERQAPAEASQPSTGPITSGPATAPRSAAEFAAAPAPQAVSLGGGPDDPLEVDLVSRGAAVAGLKLTRRENGKYVHSEAADTNEPYRLLRPFGTGRHEQLSYTTGRIFIGGVDWDLARLEWNLVEHESHRAVFVATLASPDGPLLRVRKTYTLESDKPLVYLDLRIENVSGRPLDVSIEQFGPAGVPREHLQYSMRSASWALREEDGLVVDAVQHGALKSGEQRLIGNSKDGFLWLAVANKYFGAFTRPLGTDGGPAGYLQAVHLLDSPPELAEVGDLLARFTTYKEAVASGAAADYRFEIYAGTKDRADLARVNEAFASETGLNYVAARDADYRCCCTFGWLTDIMIGMLEGIHYVVRNYGVAIIILVIIVRTLLHPLAVFQQKSMYRMQEAQARIQPKMNAIRQRYPDDKVKQNQEMMRLMADEGVNPAAGMVGMLPMFLQMPILIALWTGLNTDVNLRHAPFDGWWIEDLSAPDALITFPGDGVTIPVLGWVLPFMFANIPSFNLLPILMGVSMWLQQKYMPKPHMEARLEAAKQQSQEKNSLGMTPEEQMRQQAMIGYMMSIMFPLMFYYMPAGLNLYWLATNVFGIGESLIIRKQLREEKERRKLAGPDQPAPKTRKNGILARFFRNLAEQAEELQRKADTLSQQEARNPDRVRKEKNKRKKGGDS